MNGYVRRFLVANLADHDDVGILPDNRTQAAGESKPDFRQHVNLVDPFDLVFDGVLDGDDLLFRGADAIERGIESRRLAAAGGTRHENHAVGA